MQDVTGGLAGVLVLGERLPGRQRDHSLAEYVLVTAVDGVGTTPTGSAASQLQLLPSEGRQRGLLHEPTLAPTTRAVDRPASEDYSARFTGRCLHVATR